MSPGFIPESAAGVARISVISAREPSSGVLASATLAPIQPCADLAETNEIAPDFFGGFNRQCVTGRIILQAADQDPDHFAFQIQQWRAGFAALRRQVHAQMRGRKITAQIFAIEPGDHSEARSLGKIERITNRDDRSGHFEIVALCRSAERA